MHNTEVSLTHKDDYWLGRFQAMASPCEILIDTTDKQLAQAMLSSAHAEAQRIEQKFSRYRDDNIIFQINHANGAPVVLDDETAALIDYAAQCYQLSEGRFDITSGVLRRIWNFDGSDRIPQPQQVRQILTQIGWPKVSWQRPEITLPAGMEIDLGGIGKEYAVDKTALLLNEYGISVLVNFGGDLYCNRKRSNGESWVVGIEDPAYVDGTPMNNTRPRINDFALERGGIATSGDTRRFILKDGVRYGHILDPRTGWPVINAPHSVTVAAASCTDAGIIATLAMLQGEDAEAFLQQQGVQYWCYR